VSELGKPVVHRFDDGEDSVATITRRSPILFVSIPGASHASGGPAHVKRDKRVRGSRTKSITWARASSRAAPDIYREPAPEGAFIRCSAKSVRKSCAEYRLMITIRAKRERFAGAFAKIGAEKVRTQVRPLFGTEITITSPRKVPARDC